jgi:Mrp family chromosome partitioning ATPase
MLEALRQGDSPRLARPVREDQPPILCPAPDEAGEAADSDAEIDIPFVEVGPSRSVEGSPEVMATPPLRLRTAPPVSRGATQVVFRPVQPPAPRSRFAPELMAFHAPELPAGMQYHELLEAVLAALGSSSQQRCPVLLFTALRSGAGATTVVLNMAITAARGQRSILVVDANLRSPAVAERLGLPAAPGLREVLAGTASLDGALQQTEQEGLRVLTAGLAVAGPGPRFVAETMRSLVRQLRQRAELVLIDGPCWDGGREVITLAAAADAVYPVLPENEAETAEADDLLEAVADHGALAGCVLASR